EVAAQRSPRQKNSGRDENAIERRRGARHAGPAHEDRRPGNTDDSHDERRMGEPGARGGVGQRRGRQNIRSASAIGDCRAVVRVVGFCGMVARLRKRNEWKFFAVLPKADAPLAILWWVLLVLRGVLPAALAIAMGRLVAVVQEGGRLAGALAPVGGRVVLLP